MKHFATKSGEITKRNNIGTLNEMSLHSALKAWYKHPGDRLEVNIDGFVVDIIRADHLVEIQTRNFSAIKHKLIKLIDHHKVRLVHPIPREKWIIRVDSNGRKSIGRRKSPKRGRIEHLFTELVSFPDLVAHPNFSIEVLFTQEEEIWSFFQLMSMDQNTGGNCQGKYV